MKTKKETKNLALAAVLAALTAVVTAYVLHIPTPTGYIHFGDSLIYLAACVLPKPYAMAVGAIGGGVADLLTAPAWTLPTVIIKMLIVLAFSSKSNKIVTKRNIVAGILAFFISATGYFLAESLVFGYEVAFITSVTGSAIQSFGSLAAFVVFGLALDKMNIKRRM